MSEELNGQFCSLCSREADWISPLGVIWRHTGRPGYYLLLGTLLPGRCNFSGKPTCYVDLLFDSFLHPDEYENTWDNYARTYQSSEIA